MCGFFPTVMVYISQCNIRNVIVKLTYAQHFKHRVFSAYVKEIEEKPGPTPWGKKMNFSNCMAEFYNGSGGWVHSVAFSPSGNKLAWAGHDSSISVVNQAAEQ